MRTEIIAIPVVIFLLLLVGIVIFLDKDGELVGDIHEHADFKLYIDGNSIDFSQERYQSTENKSLSAFIHFHDMDGNVIHKHASKTTLDFLFDSINMSVNSSCLKVDGNNYCNTEEKTLKMFVQNSNGQWTQNTQYGSYEFKDLDRILISYGSDNAEQIKSQQDSVTDNACIFSEKCPERGSPPPEASCTNSKDCVV